MTPADLWAAVRRWYESHSARDRRIIVGIVAAAGLSLVYVALVEPLLDYRRAVAAEIAEGHEQLERSVRFLAALDTLRAERQEVRQRLEQAKQRLLPGHSGTLGAAALQDRANALAAEKGVTVQSTQVMREETLEPFRKVAVRLTVSGELRPMSEFLAGFEYGPQHLTLPFVELTRRGAVAGAKGPRTLSATVEVSGFLLGRAEARSGEPETAEAEGDDPSAAPPPGAASDGEASPRPAPPAEPGGEGAGGAEPEAAPLPAAPPASPETAPSARPAPAPGAAGVAPPPPPPEAR